MAKMFPRQPRSSTKSRAELGLFEIFAKHLSDDYHVFHAVEIQVPRQRGGVDDYEIDFLIAHPQRGIILLEVKGGLIRVDSTSAQWQRQDRGKWISFDSPIEQVKGASYELFKYLKDQQPTRSFDYVTWYAVALPDVDVDHHLSPGIPRDIILDKARLHPNQIEATIGRLFAYYDRSDHKSPPGVDGLKALGSVIAPNWFLRSTMGTEFIYEASAIKELTEEQFQILDAIEFRDRALIAGCAGSGKTMLALEMAQRFCGKHKRVLLTCYNKALSHHLSENQLPDNLMIRHFHSLAHYVFGKAEQRALWTELFNNLNEKEDHDFWTATLPDHLFNVVDMLPDNEKFDAIVVDEGQDFHMTYWLPLQMLLKDPDEGILYIFYDEAQRIYSLDEFPIKGGPAIVLKKNLRSTRPIGEFIVDYYPGKDQFIPAGAASQQDVMLVDPAKYESPAAALNDILNMLTDEKVPLRDVAILTMASQERSQWQHRQELADGYDLRWLNQGNQIKGKRVLVSTIQGFKGLERPVIILTELDTASREEQQDKLVYIGMSRARNLLVILGGKPPLPKT